MIRDWSTEQIQIIIKNNNFKFNKMYFLWYNNCMYMFDEIITIINRWDKTNKATIANTKLEEFINSKY